MATNPNQVIILKMELIEYQDKLIKLLENEIIQLRLPNKPSTLIQIATRKKATTNLRALRSQVKYLYEKINKSYK